MAKKTQKYWFKRRRYGYGWVPVTWQGWTAFVVFFAIIVVNAFVVAVLPYSNELLWLYFNILIIAVVALLVVARLKGPKGKWRWGKTGSDNKDEDF